MGGAIAIPKESHSAPSRFAQSDIWEMPLWYGLMSLSLFFGMIRLVIEGLPSTRLGINLTIDV
jgi:hypothetical protein